MAGSGHGTELPSRLIEWQAALAGDRSWQGRLMAAAAAAGAATPLPDFGDAGLVIILGSPVAAAVQEQPAWDTAASSLLEVSATQEQVAWDAGTDAAVEVALAARQQWAQAQQAPPQHAPPVPPHRIPPSSLACFPQPGPCAFLRPGQSFEGRQRVAHHHGPVPKQEHWSVHAVIQHYDPGAGYVAGCMEASNVPDMPAPVTTFFEGEIIDNVHNTFFTADWDACADTDFLHWSKFVPFRQLRAEVVRNGGRCPGLASHPYVYMRWKEQFFVRGSECRLTIAGFYYLAVNRVTGTIAGYYFDPSSSPDQKLELTAVRAGPAGFAFPHYELA